jgi:hypothetical protein
MGLLLFSSALAQRTDLRGIVPGDELRWSIDSLNTNIVISKATTLSLQIYSPGFDPNDYRSNQSGGDELGDERYDKGQGSLSAKFTFKRGSKVLAQTVYGIESHRWREFFRGSVQPGVYQISSQFKGFGKNAFRYRLQTSLPGTAKLVLDPSLQLYDIQGGPRSQLEPYKCVDASGASLLASTFSPQ